jgi:RecT family
VIEQAMRWGMSPFAVAQCTSVIQGKLMFEGKLVSAALHTSGLLETRLREQFSGEGATRAVTLSGTIRGETQPREIKVTLAEAKTSNGMWTKQPDQQLIYFATRAWARRHAPEVMLGVYSPEEFDEPPKRDNFVGTTIEAQPESTEPEAARKPTVTEWLKQLDVDLANAATGEEVDAILSRQDVQDAQDRLRNGAKDRLQHMIDVAIKRTSEAESSAPADAAEVE